MMIVIDSSAPGRWRGYRPRRAIVPLAGRASRLWPASLAIPKALFPLIDQDGVARPVIGLILAELQRAGITEVCLVTGPGDDQVYRRYFDALARTGFDADIRNVRVGFATQREPLGFGHAVWCGRDFTVDEPVLVVLGDHVYATDAPVTCAGQVLDTFARHGMATSGVAVTPEADIGGFGTVAAVELEDDHGTYAVSEIVEKPDVETARLRLRVSGLPAGTYLSWFGIHAMTPRLFEILEDDYRLGRKERGEIQLTSAQGRLCADEPYLATVVSGTRHDTGDPVAWLATQDALRPRPDR
ncbi:MAG: sugar phosphate nucleotidyltransferase [Chloroflexi bacterium]|nr:sugar phosphate nucleotidyltransferase [Chloroflexota bacterium]